MTRQLYPVLWKIAPFRTDNGTGFGAGVNSGSTRPMVIAKFSELYFIAAEAAVKGATGAKSAFDLIKVIRERAGKWRWDNNNGVKKVEDHSAEMVAKMPTTITIDYILDERSRELFGESIRWYDLTRTQTWDVRAKTYEMGGISFTEHDKQTFTRTMTKGHYLRPIPQGQLDALEMTADEKKAYQNPEYK